MNKCLNCGMDITENEQAVLTFEDEFGKLHVDYFHGDTLQCAEALKAENARLRRGDFTPEELQELCHNLSEDDYCKFADGCDAYQQKLFGKCRSDELRA